MTGGTAIRRIIVVRSPLDRSRGTLSASGLVTPCALGRAGLSGRKREGDGATPTGRLRLISVLYRADRTPRPTTRLPAAAISPHSGWCDDPTDRLYNRPVRLPYPARHERLWREDHLYDLTVVLNYNLSPVIGDAGSAVFLHLAAADLRPTAGCIAIPRAVMIALLWRVTTRSYLDIS